jgi:phage terminase large subunit-like protein
MTCNRFGKTFCGCRNGLSPNRALPGMVARRAVRKRVRAWAAGVTNESARDIVQEKLIGSPFRRSEWGCGMVPKHCLGEFAMARGTADLIDTISILHTSGGYSTLQFKSYSEGREKWQGQGLEVCWMDEEPEAELYYEALTRSNETGGILFITFSPLKGMSEIVRMFMAEAERI